jgi:tetratricopeptide (TPR) repeat protein
VAEEQLGIHLVGAEAKRWRWLFRDQPVEDYGVDCEAELPGADYPTGRTIGIQVKTGRAKYFRSPAPGAVGWWYSPSTRSKGEADRHLRYWLEHDKRIILVLVDETTTPERMYWVHVTLDRVEFTGRSWKILVPATQPLDGTAQTAFRSIAAAPRSAENADVLAVATAALPPQVGRTLRALCSTDHFKALQLAVTLSRCSADPSAVCERLLGQDRRYLEGGAGLLYLAVASFAAAHHAPVLAARAFFEAAQLNEGERWRYLAHAAWSHYCADERVQSAERVEQAEAAGAPATLCAWLRAFIEHQGPGTPSVSKELIEATRTDIDAVPLYRLFLAFLAVAAGDLTGAVRLHEQALEREPDNSQHMLNLANVLLIREASNRSPLPGADLSTALRLAVDARDQRRQWSGPSEDAVIEIIHALQMITDFPTGLRFAAPAPHGEATERESACPTIAFLGAKMALALGQQETARHIAARVATGSSYALAVELMLDKPPTSQASTAWLKIFREAITDPDLAVYALHQAAACGLWPLDEIEVQRAEGVITTEGYETLRARSQAARGDTDAAARTLRPYLSVSPVAAESLVEILEDSGLFDEALGQCERAHERFRTVSLAIKRWNLLLRLDRTPEAIEHAIALLARPDLPAMARTTLREFVATNAQERHDWSVLEEHCQAALREGCGTQLLAWLYIGAAYNQRRWSDAWERYGELKPPIVRPAEAGMWIALHAYFGFSEQDIADALDLFDRFPDEREVRGQVIAVLLSRGNKLAPDGTPILPMAPGVARIRLQAALEEFLADGVSGLRVIAAGSVPETMGQVFEGLVARAPLDAYLEECLRAGAMPLVVACSATGESYAEALLTRAHGAIIAVTDDLAEFEVEMGDAAAALDRSVLLDASALAVLSELPDASAGLLGGFAEASVDDETHFVCLTACSEVRQIPGTVSGIGLAEDGRTLSAKPTSEASILAQTARADELEKLLSRLSTFEAAVEHSAQNPWMRCVQVALGRQMALWCDDVALRREARAAGCPTFGTVALLHVMAETSADEVDLRPRMVRLAASEVGNIVLEPEEIQDLAIGNDGMPGPAARALARSTFASNATIDDLTAVLRDVLAQLSPLTVEAADAWMSEVGTTFAPYLEPEHIEPTLNSIAAVIAPFVAEPGRGRHVQIAGRIAVEEATRREAIIGVLQDDLQAAGPEDPSQSRPEDP